MEAQPKYKFYATLLDAYFNYLQSDELWERYWGWSDNPPHTPEEYRAKQFGELIDRINRKPFDSEAADRGTAFNELVDALIEHRQPAGMEVMRNEDQTRYEVIFRGNIFSFPISLCLRMAGYYKGALTQVRVEAPIDTAYGQVLVYGLIDELMPASVHDIKTTGSYQVGKFRHHHQHLVYPYALMQTGNDVRTFEYNVVELGRGDSVTGIYTETYVFQPERDIPVLRDHCEQFVRFVEENRHLITDKKIFGGE